MASATHSVVNGKRVDLAPAEQTKIEAGWAAEDTRRAAVRYQELRKLAYPRIEDQLDMLWRAMDGGAISKADEFYEAIKAVKDAYSKPRV